MLTEFTTPFVEAKDEFIAWANEETWTATYPALMRKAIELINKRAEFGYGKQMDPERVHVVDDGDYQGTMLIIVAATGYQPSTYWYTKVNYGSCSGCDALQDAWTYGENPDREAVYTVALHLVQGLKETQ